MQSMLGKNVLGGSEVCQLWVVFEVVTLLILTPKSMQIFCCTNISKMIV